MQMSKLQQILICTDVNLMGETKILEERTGNPSLDNIKVQEAVEKNARVSVANKGKGVPLPRGSQEF
jgi:hypothetical protein